MSIHLTATPQGFISWATPILWSRSGIVSCYQHVLIPSVRNSPVLRVFWGVTSLGLVQRTADLSWSHLWSATSLHVLAWAKDLLRNVILTASDTRCVIYCCFLTRRSRAALQPGVQSASEGCEPSRRSRKASRASSYHSFFRSVLRSIGELGCIVFLHSTLLPPRLDTCASPSPPLRKDC
jgi:hypothetical protein